MSAITEYIQRFEIKLRKVQRKKFGKKKDFKLMHTDLFKTASLAFVLFVSSFVLF